jgi:flavin reductase (DIM6/NTAB) family NADH-FMN oxidoreductase RutF
MDMSPVSQYSFKMRGSQRFYVGEKHLLELFAKCILKPAILYILKYIPLCKLFYSYIINIVISMLSISPSDTPQNILHGYLVSSVGPRPICFASTIDAHGNPNLSPFSFFNIFGSNPPIAVFSPARSGRTGQQKNTVENVLEVPEVVINVVSYNMVQQASLASAEYPKGVNEFVKSGFTPIASEKVRPFRVKESPVQMECKVLEVKHTGSGGGSGNLIICEVILMHINEDVLNADKKIDPHKIDLVGRMGGNWYCRASGAALFEQPQPMANLGIGVDALPATIRNSKILSGNDLGKLGNLTHLPSDDDVKQYAAANPKKLPEEELHQEVKKLLEQNRIEEAWKLLLAEEK